MEVLCRVRLVTSRGGRLGKVRRGGDGRRAEVRTGRYRSRGMSSISLESRI